MTLEPIQAAALPATDALGFAPMDAVHHEFDLLLGAAQQATADLDTHLTAVADHLRTHFEAEGRWMAGSGYPNAQCHLDEHAAVLTSAHEVMALPSTRRPTVARAFFRELASWFPAHARHLDSALAHWMVKQAHGGKPVVLHARRGAVTKRLDPAPTPAGAAETDDERRLP